MTARATNYWFAPEHTDDQLASVVFRTAKAIVDDQAHLRERWRQEMMFYKDQPIREMDGTTLGLLDYGGLEVDPVKTGLDTAWNFCKTLPDALISKLTLQNTTITYETREGSEDQQLRAQEYRRFVQGELRALKQPAKKRRRLRLSTAAGMGFVKVWPDFMAKRPMSRVYGPDRIIVDDRRSSAHDMPPSLFHVDMVDEDELLAMFQGPKFASVRAKIKLAPVVSDLSGIRRMIEVIDAYHLQVGDTKGRRVLCVANAVLVDEPYTETTHCFAWERYREPLSGFYGESLVGEIISTQREINYILRDLRGNTRSIARSHVEVDPESPLALEMGQALTSDGYRVLPPGSRVIHPPIVNPQTLQVLQVHVGKIFELTGLNLLAATAALPPGIESGRAIQMLDATQSQRFSEVQHNSSEADVMEAELVLRAGKTLNDAGAYDIAEPGLKKALPFDDEELDRYVLTADKVSQLPQDPAGKQETVQFLMANGLIDRERALQLIGFTDLEKEMALEAAPRDALEFAFESMLSGGEYEPPVPEMMNLQLGLRLVVLYWNRAKRRGKRVEALDKLVRWARDAAAILEPPQPPEGPSIQDLGQGPIPEGLAADPAAAAQLAQAAALAGGNGQGVPV